MMSKYFVDNNVKWAWFHFFFQLEKGFKYSYIIQMILYNIIHLFAYT